MNTRRASEDSPFRQERYMSAPEMVRGLLANCVAARVQTLANPSHRKLIWWLQKVSWQPGGLDKIAADIIARWPERFATKAVQRIGIAPDRIYSAEEVKEARDSINGTQKKWGGRSLRRTFGLRGEGCHFVTLDDFLLDDARRRKWSDFRTRKAKEFRESRSLPKTYPANAFTEYCLEEARLELPKFLFEKLCLDPSIQLNDETLWYFPQLTESLQELHNLQAAEADSAAPWTQIGAQVGETLEYALEQRGLVVIDGVARTGKTFSVKAWCAAHPGQARYVQVPSSNDDLSFYRALCDALGIGSSVAYKALELRAKIETVLHSGDLLLILDEGHYLWPQRNLRKAMPTRINWLLTQCVNMGVPVAIVTTPQFTKNQETLVKNSGWSSEQLVGRIMYYERLPDSLGEGDLEAVARYWLSGGDEKSIRMLIAYAQSSEKYLQAIEALVRRARFVARKADREQPTFADVADALQGGVVPSDNALAAARLGAQQPARRKTLRAPAALPVQAVCAAAARTMHESGPRPGRKKVGEQFQAPARDDGASVLST